MISSESSRRVLIIGSDGMRPDAVNPELMPTYSRLIREGMLFTRFHAAYPSETRVSMTTLTTGVYPGRHGVVANRLYLPGFRHDGRLETGDHRHFAEYTGQTGEPIVLRPTLGDRLYAAGRHLAVVGAGSPGSSLLWNITHPEKVINLATDYGIPSLAEIRRQVGPVPGGEFQSERLSWAVKALLEVHLPDIRNQALVLWLSQPDKASHDFGLGSPEVREAHQWVDRCLARVLDALQQRDEDFDLFLISDHGHTTLDAQGALSVHLAEGCRQLGIDVPFDVSGKYIFNKMPVSDDIVRILIDWLKKQSWCGAVFANHPQAEKWGALAVETLLGAASPYTGAAPYYQSDLVPGA